MPNRFFPETSLVVLRAQHLLKLPWLVHGFSTRRRGATSPVYGGACLNLAFTNDASKYAVERNRAMFLSEVGAVDGLDTRPARARNRGNNFRVWPLITLRQVHSDIIRFVDSPGGAHLVGDGLITSTPGLLLAIQTADCLPVILADSKHRTVGVFHAGWRGTLRRIVEKGVGEMRRFFGTHPRYIKAAIGPGIHACCYQVGDEVREKFESQFSYAARLFREVKESDPVREKYPLLFLAARPPGHSDLPKKIFLDLVEANRQQLLAVGVKPGNIDVSPLCTSCRTDLLFSYRAEKGKTGRMMAVAGIKQSKKRQS